MKKFEYFVSFSCRKGFGNCLVEKDHPISTYEDIKDIEKHMRDHNIPNCIILNFQLLNESEE